MNDTPLISIAVCTYNGSKFLSEQFDTLVNQTYPNLEIIIVDDCSKDDTWAILTDYSNRYSNVRIFQNEKNLGYIKNFEKAISLCAGDYIALSDQDDIWDLNKITLLFAGIENNMLVYHDSEFVDHAGKSLNKKMSDVVGMYSGHSALPFLLYNSVSGHACMFKRELIKHYGYLDAAFHHDWWIAMVAAYYGGVKYLDMPLVKYRQHGSAFTDILNIKKEQKRAPLKSSINLSWIKNAARIGGLSSYVNKLVKAFNNRSLAGNLILMTLLLKDNKLLFALKRKSWISNVNYIRKLSFAD